MTHRAPDAGSLSIELAILLPAFLMLALLATAFGREAIAQSAVDLAAHDAARAASISRTAAGAQSAATIAAQATLGDESSTCTSLSVTVDTSQFALPVGTPASVRATVSCTVSLADLALPGMPGSRVLTASFTSPLDVYRARSLGPAFSPRVSGGS